MAGRVSDAVIRRLPGYYRHLRELEAAGVTSISSQELGERMHLTPSQIRQDINCFGGFGRQGYGYRVSELKGHIGDCPVKYGFKGAIPALIKSKLLSLCGTREKLFIFKCSLLSKNSRYILLSSFTPNFFISS